MNPCTRLRAAFAAGLFLAVALMAPAGAADQSAWQTIDRPPPVVGADGLLHEASCSGYPGTDASFRFWVRPGDPRKLAVVFDGGGACWDNLTCSNPFGGDGLLTFYSPDIPAGADPSRYGGLLDLDNPANPVRDWTVVGIPYCTGDVHLGSADRAYRMVGHRDLPRDFTIRHRGYDNFMVVLDWITRNVPQGVTDLLVTGASAGGYGATGHSPWLAQAYPQARLSVLADASQGVTTTGFDSGTPGRGSWNAQLAPWVFGDDPLAVRSYELMQRNAAAFPGGRFAQYTTTLDSVQLGFYAVMRLRHGPSDGSCRRLLADWNGQMLAHLAADSTLPNFRAYVAPGTSHTILADDAFYVPMGGQPSVSNWLTAMLDPARTLAWDDIACPDCLTPLPCR
jgi:Pectinacetylesterase